MIEKSYLAEYSKKPSKNIHQSDPKSQPIIGWVIQIYYFFVGAAALPARLLLRDNFGERSVSPTGWGVSLFLHIWYLYEYIALYMGLAIFLGHAFFLNEPDFSPSGLQIIMMVLAVIFNGFHLYLFEVFINKSRKHYRQAVKNVNTPNLEHGSFYRGDSKYYNHLIGQKIKTFLGKLTVNTRILKMVVEPRKAFRAGLLLFLISIVLVVLIQVFIQSFWGFLISAYIFSFSAVGLVIAISGICLFLEELGIYLRIREGAYDLIDGEKDLALVLAQKEQWKSSKNPLTTKRNETEKDSFPVVHIV